MIQFSDDPKVAEQQMHAILFYLTTFGYIDGDFDQTEKSFVREYVRKLVVQRVEGAMPDGDAKTKAELVQKYTTHFHEVFEGIDANVKDLFTEAVAEGENQDQFVHAKLKLRCFEIFQDFDRQGQESLMETIDELIMADGTAHPAEVKFRAELAALLEADLGIELEDEGGARPAISVSAQVKLVPSMENHPFFGQFEHHYSGDPEKIRKQIAADEALLDRAIGVWHQQRTAGAGKLAGKQKVQDFAGQPGFLDGHIYVLPDAHPAGTELTVLGDLHGCYSCLKAAILQSRFFERVEAYRKSPATTPLPKLVLLGDYIDRGMFSLNGVFRTVLQLVCTAPEHVHVLRGNHEYFVEFKGQVFGGVKPAESINTLKSVNLPVEIFQHYIRAFDSMPNVLFAGTTMFVHAGIPRDLLLKERYKDLSSLNDPDMRFQMMWSDPSKADVIPAALQEQSARFPFGRLQAQAFLHRMGCSALVRGHEKVDAGFARTYDDGQILLITLFSAGGDTNDDLPLDSSYRTVTPMALTVTMKGGETSFAPWAIDYETYNDPERNAFFKVPPEIAMARG